MPAKYRQCPSRPQARRFAALYRHDNHAVAAISMAMRDEIMGDARQAAHVVKSGPIGDGRSAAAQCRKPARRARRPMRRRAGIIIMAIRSRLRRSRFQAIAHHHRGSAGHGASGHAARKRRRRSRREGITILAQAAGTAARAMLQSEMVSHRHRHHALTASCWSALEYRGSPR